MHQLYLEQHFLKQHFEQHIQALADHAQTQNDVFLKSCILMVQHYRKTSKTIARDAGMLEHLRDLCDNMMEDVLWELWMFFLQAGYV